MQASINRGTIAATERLIRPYVRRTPVITIDAGDFGLAPRPLAFTSFASLTPSNVDGNCGFGAAADFAG